MRALGVTLLAATVSGLLASIVVMVLALVAAIAIATGVGLLLVAIWPEERLEEQLEHVTIYTERDPV